MWASLLAHGFQLGFCGLDEWSVRWIENWLNGRTQRVVIQTQLDAVLCSLLWVTLLRQGVGLGDPQRSLPTPAIL